MLRRFAAVPRTPPERTWCMCHIVNLLRDRVRHNLLAGANTPHTAVTPADPPFGGLPI